MKSILLILIFAAGAFGQTYVAPPGLPSNFEYKRETGQKSGLPVFTLSVHGESMAYDASEGNGFEALGAHVQPERAIYGLMFANAKAAYQLSTSKDRTCTLLLDGEAFEYPEFINVTKAPLGKLRVEFVALKIEKAVFFKLVKSHDASIRCGPVRYSLDGDNMEALRYLGHQIDQDLARRNKSAL